MEEVEGRWKELHVLASEARRVVIWTGHTCAHSCVALNAHSNRTCTQPALLGKMTSLQLWPRLSAGEAPG